MKIDKKIIIILVIVVLISVMTVNVLRRNSKIKNDGMSAVVKITRLQKKRKGSTTSITQAFFELLGENGQRTSGFREISNSSVEVGSCYNAIFVPDNPKIVKVQFGAVIICPDELVELDSNSQNPPQ